MPIGRRSLAGALAVATVVACGFPDVIYSNADGVPDGGSGASDAAGGGNASDATPGDGADGANDGYAANDGPEQDVATDSASRGAPADGPPSCDQDGDGYLARVSPCNGTDCCDMDPNAHPGQTQFFAGRG